MLIIKKGNILNAEENLICHQTNIKGVMGGGLALQIARAYPNVNEEYKQLCRLLKYSESLIGQYQAVKIKEHKYIVNCFSQKTNFNTDLDAIDNIFIGLLETCKRNNFTIAIPYGYGSGIANGDWKEISKLFERLSNQYDIDINVYKLEEV